MVELTITIDDQDRNTILAALRYYQANGQGEPSQRDDAIHELATCGDEQISMDAIGIDELCERFNCGLHVSTKAARLAAYSEMEVDADDPCQECGVLPGTPAYGTVGDGFDGLCPSCADRAEEKLNYARAQKA